MSAILVAGFEPFGTDARNPSGEIARALDGTKIAGAAISSLVLPVARDRIEGLIARALARVAPDAVVGLGLATDRALVSVEQVAVNLDDFPIPDADGAQPRGERIAKDGPDALLATLPVAGLAGAVRASGVPATVSLTAGTYLCNHVFYRLLQSTTPGPGPRLEHAVFVHLPPLPECVAELQDARASMALETSARGVRALITEVVRLVQV